MTEIPILISLASLGLSCFNTVTHRYVSKEQAARDADFQVLKKQVDLFWGMVEKHMTTVLHSPHTPDRDKLLEKIQAGEELDDAEIQELACELQGVINDTEEAQGNRAAAVWLLAWVERLRLVRQSDTH